MFSFNTIHLLALLMIVATTTSCYSMEINSLVYDGGNESPIGWLADQSLKQYLNDLNNGLSSSTTETKSLICSTQKWSRFFFGFV